MNLKKVREQSQVTLQQVLENNTRIEKLLGELNHNYINPEKPVSDKSEKNLSQGLILDIDSIQNQIMFAVQNQYTLINKLESTIYHYGQEDDAMEDSSNKVYQAKQILKG